MRGTRSGCAALTTTSAIRTIAINALAAWRSTEQVPGKKAIDFLKHAKLPAQAGVRY
jgi:hypothetical protein